MLEDNELITDDNIARVKDLLVCMENGNEIPLPEEMNQKSYSGKLVLRIPKELHRKLSENAENNNVSLNSYINMLLVANNSKIESLSDMIDFLPIVFKELISS